MLLSWFSKKIAKEGMIRKRKLKLIIQFCVPNTTMKTKKKGWKTASATGSQLSYACCVYAIACVSNTEYAKDNAGALEGAGDGVFFYFCKTAICLCLLCVLTKNLLLCLLRMCSSRMARVGPVHLCTQRLAYSVVCVSDEWPKEICRLFFVLFISLCPPF